MDKFRAPSTPSFPGAEPRANIVLVAAAALCRADGTVLLSKRSEGRSMAGLWEFPGGKVEAGETPEVALVRELDEELGLQAEARALTPIAFASHAYEEFHLLMPLFLCRAWQGRPRPREGQEIRWVAPCDMQGLAMLPADAPLVEILCRLL